MHVFYVPMMHDTISHILGHGSADITTFPNNQAKHNVNDPVPMPISSGIESPLLIWFNFYPIVDK